MSIEKPLLTDSFEHSILIVDDTPNNLRLLSTFLQEFNYEISVARSGEQALEQLNFVLPDLIIMDVVMPGIDGFETCRRLKANERTRDIPVIFMTALSGTNDMLRGFEAGGIDYLTKPIQQAEALARIDVHLRMSKLTKQLQQTNQSLQQEVDKRREAENRLISNQKRLEELVSELAEARDQAQRANEAKSVFLAGMSHELRTPLNAILGYAQVLQNRPLDSDTLNDIHTIQQSGEHLLTLINDSLDIAKIEAGKMELQASWIHFPKFLHGVTSIIQTRAESNHLQFIFKPSDNLPTGIQADETRLRQVLLNLLGNAVKFTNEGTVTFHVRKGEGENTAVSPTHQSLVFEVEDTGIGLTSDEISRIFQPYVQAGSTRNRREGTGLGLSISQQLVQLMGGTLHVHSTPGQGSTFGFEVTFPVSEMTVKKAEWKQTIPTGYQGNIFR